MADEALLLRMLEPAVRPTGVPGRSDGPRPAVEDRTFDQMLADAAARTNHTTDTTSDTNATEPANPQPPDLLEHLGRLGLTTRQAATFNAAHSGATNPNPPNPRGA